MDTSALFALCTRGRFISETTGNVNFQTHSTASRPPDFSPPLPPRGGLTMHRVVALLCPISQLCPWGPLCHLLFKLAHSYSFLTAAFRMPRNRKCIICGDFNVPNNTMLRVQEQWIEDLKQFRPSVSIASYVC